MDECIARLSRIETTAVNFIHQVSSGLPSSISCCSDVDDIHA
ncbi:MAG: hypothetical protein ACTSSE_08755 [Candidatus Thorarchaeota archaeon]